MTTRHESCGNPLTAYPAVIHSEGLVVLLGGNLGVPHKTGILEKGTEGIFFECLDETCPDTEWTFVPFSLAELVYLGVRVEETFGMSIHFFNMPDSTGLPILLPDSLPGDSDAFIISTEGRQMMHNQSSSSVPLDAADIKIDPRPSWDEYFLEIAKVISTRADCTRAHHGAVIVDSDKRLVSTGYNGSPSGAPGCLTAAACPRGRLTSEELGHLAGGYDDPLSPGFCTSIHAEANAIIYAGRSRTAGSTIYITGEPCHGCVKLIHAAGLIRIVHGSLTGTVTMIEI